PSQENAENRDALDSGKAIPSNRFRSRRNCSMSQSVLNSLVHQLTETIRRTPTGERTDAELLGRFIDQRDQQSFAVLLQRHGPMVFGVCCRLLQNTHDAEDAFQTTFLVLARRAASIAPRECVAAWLHGVAWRTARKARSLAQRQRVREGVPLQAGPEPEVPCINAWSDLRLVIDAELS